MEIMVASTIGAFIAMVAVGTLRTVIASSEMLDTAVDDASEVRFASNILKRDLVNFYRDPNYANTEMIGTVEELSDFSTSYLVFYTLNRTKARAYEPEGDVYEVEYYLVESQDNISLMRRVWPNPNDEFEPGGLLTTIAENIALFEVRFFDGEDWYNEWPEDMQELPDLIEVNIASKQQSRGNPVMESFIVNLVRSVTATSETTESE